MPKVPKKLKILKTKKISLFSILVGQWLTSTVDDTALFLVNVDPTALFQPVDGRRF